MDKSESETLSNESGLEESRENQVTSITGGITSIDRSLKQIDEDLFVLQMQIVNRAKCREILNKSMTLLLTAREKILLYNDHAEHARRKLKEAREAIYLMDVDDINLAAEFEEKIQAAIKRLAKLEEKKLRAEHKTELSHRIAEAEQIVKSLQTRNDIVHDTLTKKIAVIAQFRQNATAKRNQLLATRNTINGKNRGSL